MEARKGMYCLSICLLCTSLLGACQQGASTPQMSPKQMAQVLKDIHLADGWVDQEGGSLDRRNDIRDELYDEILDQYGLNRQTFYQDYQYYINHPLELDTIYLQITAELEDQLETLKSEDLERRRLIRRIDTTRWRDTKPKSDTAVELPSIPTQKLSSDPPNL